MADKGVKLINKDTRAYLHSEFVNDRYLLAEDLNKNNQYTLEVMSDIVKSTFGSGNIIMYDESTIENPSGNTLRIRNLNLFVDGIPFTIDDVILSSDGYVSVAFGIKVINYSSSLNVGGKIDNLTNIPKNGVNMNAVRATNDVHLVNPVYGDSWTSNRKQIQYQVYFGNDWRNNTGDGSLSGMGRGSNVEIANFYTLVLGKKTGNKFSFLESDFSLTSPFGGRNKLLKRLEDLDTQTFDGYADNSTRNKPVDTSKAIVENTHYKVGNTKEVSQRFIDFIGGWEYVRVGTYRDNSEVIDWRGWQQRLFTQNIITMEELNAVHNEIIS